MTSYSDCNNGLNTPSGRYPAYVGSGYATSSSSRTNSTSSLYPGSVAGSHHYAPSPLAPSSHGSASARSSSERGRTQLKQNHTWPNSVDSTGSAASACELHLYTFICEPSLNLIVYCSSFTFASTRSAIKHASASSVYSPSSCTPILRCRFHTISALCT